MALADIDVISPWLDEKLPDHDPNRCTCDHEHYKHRLFQFIGGEDSERTHYKTYLDGEVVTAQEMRKLIDHGKSIGVYKAVYVLHRCMKCGKHWSEVTARTGSYAERKTFWEDGTVTETDDWRE